MKEFFKQTKTRITYLILMTALIILFGTAGYGLVFALINGHMFVVLAIIAIAGLKMATKTLDVIIEEYKI